MITLEGISMLPELSGKGAFASYLVTEMGLAVVYNVEKGKKKKKLYKTSCSFSLKRPKKKSVRSLLMVQVASSEWKWESCIHIWTFHFHFLCAGDKADVHVVATSVPFSFYSVVQVASLKWFSHHHRHRPPFFFCCCWLLWRWYHHRFANHNSSVSFYWYFSELVHQPRTTFKIERFHSGFMQW